VTLSRTRTALEVAIETLPLKAPFRISGYTFTEVPIVVATIRDGALAGRGEAAGVYYLDDEPEGMAARIEAVRGEVEAGASRAELISILPAGGARNALDCALWELESKRAGQPVWRLAGLEPPRPLLTTFTLGADDPAAMAEGAKGFAQARALKLKLTGEAELDGERVRAVRAARPDAWIGVDANQGFDPESLARILPILVDSRVSLVEQPFRRGREADLDGVDSPIPIAADESLQGLADVAGLAGRFDVANIKLDKCGGLTEGLAIAAAARELGLQVMVGNMVGSTLAMAPAFVLGQLCDVVDLDGPLIITRDRTPSVEYEDGMVWCPEQAWGAVAG
jgi:L-alanine-DL-glutamate epimerase-like enolase superfamily enzyme